MAWKIKLPFRLALNKAASDNVRGLASITLDLENRFLAVCCVACARYVSTCFENGGVGGQVSSQLFHFLMTNGDHCTGDAFKMGKPIGAKAVELEWVQDT